MLFTLLGPVTMQHDGVVVRPSRARTRGLLAFLLLQADRLVTVDAVVDGAWGDAPPATVRSQVHAAVYALRRDLRRLGAGDLLVGDRQGYRVRAGRDEMDVAAFRWRVARGRAEAAAGHHAQAAQLLRDGLDLWGGIALADASGAFVDAARNRLDEERMSAVEDRFDADLALGRHNAVLADLQALVGEHPFREGLRARLMLALHRAGRRVEALDLFRAARAALAEEQGLEPGAALNALHEAILRADPALDPPSAAVTVTPAPAAPTPVGAGPSSSAPAQLPADTPHFTGRAVELDALGRAVGAEGSPALRVVAVVGAAGVGKTALVLHWAHTARDRFPDGQLHLDLHGFGPHPPVPPLVALERLLQALGVRGPQLPPDVEGRAALYRSLVADRRMIVLLDNAGGSEQVRHLLPGTGATTTLITSRRRLDGLVAHGAALLPVEPLSPAEADAMLTRVAGLGPGTPGLAEIGRLCDRLPLALTIAAARLRARPDQGLDAFATELADVHMRLGALSVEDGELAVRAAFEMSYRALPGPAATAFCRLALHPGRRPTLLAVAALLGRPAAAVGRVLDQLVAAHMVRPDGSGRYVMHDLLRLFAAELGADTGPEESVRRVLDWYVAAAGAADALLSGRRASAAPTTAAELPRFGDEATAAAWLDEEQENLAAAVREAVDRGWHRLVCGLVDAHWSYLGLRAGRDRWIAMATAAVTAAGAGGDRDAEALFLNGLAVAMIHTGDFDTAIEHFTRVIAIRRASGDDRGLGQALSNVASLHGDAGRPAEAVALLTEALPVLGRGDDRTILAVALNNLATNLNRLKRHREAVDAAERGLAIATEAGDSRTSSYARICLGDADAALRRFTEARGHFVAATELAGRAGDRNAMGMALLALGDLVASHTGPAEARVHWRDALVEFTALADPLAEAVASRLGAAMSAGSGG